MSALDELLERVKALPGAKRDEMAAAADAALGDRAWVPNVGPQTDAYFSLADETLYGGEAGGGKTDLLLGLPLTAHERSLVLRRSTRTLLSSSSAWRRSSDTATASMGNGSGGNSPAA